MGEIPHIKEIETKKSLAHAIEDPSGLRNEHHILEIKGQPFEFGDKQALPEDVVSQKYLHIWNQYFLGGVELFESSAYFDL